MPELQPINPQPRAISHMTFVGVLPAVIVGWILVDLWGKALNSFVYSTLKLRPDLTFHVTIIALACTCIFIAYLVCMGRTGTKIEEQMTGIYSNVTYADIIGHP